MISCDSLLELMPVTCSEEEERERRGGGRGGGGRGGKSQSFLRQICEFFSSVYPLTVSPGLPEIRTYRAVHTEQYKCCPSTFHSHYPPPSVG